MKTLQATVSLHFHFVEEKIVLYQNYDKLILLLIHTTMFALHAVPSHVHFSLSGFKTTIITLQHSGENLF